MTNEMKEITFKKINDETWRDTAVKSLRGMPYEKLLTTTAEGIQLNPIYTKESYHQHFGEQAIPFVQKVREGMQTSHWTIAQQPYATDSTAFMEQVKESLDKGNEAIVYQTEKPFTWDENDLNALANIIQTFPVYILSVHQDDEIMKVFDIISIANRYKVKGVVANHHLPEGYSNVKTVYVSTTKEHLAGADAVTELAITLAKVVKEAEHHTTFAAVMEKLVVQFAIDTDFFMEMAKLRAFRVLWHTLARSYEQDVQFVPILGETSLRTYTTYDPETNMLRAGNETLAAVLGGVDVFTVHPHLTLQGVTATSIRNARNIQLVAREEAFMKYVLDPAGGSYFIDTLTEELVQKSWSLFQTIQEKGGYDQYQASGELDKRIEQSRHTRFNDVYTGKRILVGTNKYADPNEEGGLSTSVDFDGRLARPFEELRSRLQTSAPQTVLLRFGTLATCKARTDFVKGFLAIGGIQPDESPVFSDVSTANRWIKENKYDYYIICTPPNEEMKVINELNIDTSKWVDIAGKVPEESMKTMKEQGINDMIFAGQNQYEKLTSILHTWEGGSKHA